MRISNSEGFVITVPNPGPGRSIANEVRRVHGFAAVTVSGGRDEGMDTPYQVRGVVHPTLEGPIEIGKLVRFDEEEELIGQGEEFTGAVFGRALDDLGPGVVAPCRIWIINGVNEDDEVPAGA